jgi:hypothetical protein
MRNQFTWVNYSNVIGTCMMYSFFYGGNAVDLTTSTTSTILLAPLNQWNHLRFGIRPDNEVYVVVNGNDLIREQASNTLIEKNDGLSPYKNAGIIISGTAGYHDTMSGYIKNYQIRKWS